MTTPLLPHRPRRNCLLGGIVGALGALPLEIFLGLVFGKLVDRAAPWINWVVVGIAVGGFVTGSIMCSRDQAPWWQCFVPSSTVSVVFAGLTFCLLVLFVPQPQEPQTPPTHTTAPSAALEPTTPAPVTETPAPAPTVFPMATPFCGSDLPLHTPPEGATYVVEHGDTVETVAARFGVSEEALIAANIGAYPETANPHCLRVDWVLVIPVR